ncbi:MAG: heat-inducible transcription repressor HrcA [Butyrivibrio sp.]|uniref:heat-inducible transcriptional repressor HrcA n=1 Tax=Butyrivibrio sp. NC2002 TaxID=1410610 RepID=UPI000563B8FD|nr:heat-inducible transcriptional repressor HrcA [Butyrivibrio sp. NC2002]MBE5860391.1 heat-inducible transcription repressor HrcA [Butyrivibrio sp.]
MQLDDRKKKILHAIVRNYLETGEPVGSRTISKYTDLNLSSATIRNEMADLEEMGLILQPHTSAGRIPSDQGYRVYVDAMLAEKEQEVENMKEMLLDKEEKLETLLKQVAKTLAVDTNYASMISAPMIKRNKLKFVQLSRVDETHLLVTILIEGNVIKNRMIDLEQELNESDMLKLNILLNTRLGGLSVEDINLGLIAALKQEAGIHSDIIGSVLDATAEAITEDEDLQIYTSGANNIFRYPELADKERASDLITTFEDKRDLTSLVESSLSNASEETGIQVYIGNESPVQSMKDCSVVTATYDLGEGMRGTVGVIGPKRMDYDKVVGALKNMMRALDDLYKKE